MPECVSSMKRGICTIECIFGSKFPVQTFIDKLAVGRNLFAENYWIMKWHPMWAMAMGGWYRLRCSYLFQSFQPGIQLKKFDEKGIYIRKWILI
jgi:hypothetical protein